MKKNSVKSVLQKRLSIMCAASVGFLLPALIDNPAHAETCSTVKQVYQYIQRLEDGTVTEILAKDCGSLAVRPLVDELNTNRNSTVRTNVIYTLAAIREAQIAIDPIRAVLRNRSEAPDTRKAAAFALSSFKVEPGVVPDLISALADPSEKVQAEAARSLGEIGAADKNAVHALLTLVRSKATFETRQQAATALSKISNSFYDEADNEEKVSIQQVKDVREAVKVLSEIDQALSDPAFERQKHVVVRNLRALSNAKQAFLLAIATQQLRNVRSVWLTHALFWLLLIFAYPRSPLIQSFFFWNPWMRKVAGFWYVGFALTWVPFLRMKLFEPFRESLLADAALENFNPQAYFADSEVKQLPSGQIEPIREALPSVKGQIVLEGSSGLGKTMFLRQLVKRSQRVVVYLPAEKCTKGVIEAIQAKLHGEVIKDQAFLQNLIYSGAIDVCIDGLNEVSADTRAKIVEFTENYFKGNIILATQPMEWTPPSTAKCWMMQPLRTEQIREFLVSREPLIPAESPVQGAAYVEACDRYLAQTLSSESIEEHEAAQRILSNPMDLTVVGSMLAAGKQPNLFRLQEQQYQVMTAEYEGKHLQQKFPLTAFSEAVYQMRLKDETALPEAEFLDEILCMERHKMIVSRQSLDAEGKATKEWYFRHDKIMEFFIMQTFIGKENDRPAKHLGDPRFRGVYFLLARLLPIDQAIALREQLIQYAADTKDHTVSDTFVQLLRSRSPAGTDLHKNALQTVE
jgi:hypothetical protein